MANESAQKKMQASSQLLLNTSLCASADWEGIFLSNDSMRKDVSHCDNSKISFSKYANNIFGKEFLEAEEMAQHLRALNRFSEDPD